jgi:YesN/AraC family two-component response regulator
MKPYRAIVIDDEENARTLVQSRMTNQFHQVEVVEMCGDARDALVAILKHKPDFITLDIQMPGMTGMELLKLLRESNVQTKVLVISAYSDVGYFQEAIRQGVVDYLVKPFSLDDFEEAMNRLFLRLDQEKSIDQIAEVLEHFQDEQKLKLKTTNSWLYIPAMQILYAEADGKYTNARLVNQSQEMLLYGVSQLHEILKPLGPFAKIDRSTIVNLRHVKKVYPKQGKIIFSVQNTEITVEVSAPGIANLLRLLHCKD